MQEVRPAQGAEGDADEGAAHRHHLPVPRSRRSGRGSMRVPESGPRRHARSIRDVANVTFQKRAAGALHGHAPTGPRTETAARAAVAARQGHNLMGAVLPTEVQRQRTGRAAIAPKTVPPSLPRHRRVCSELSNVWCRLHGRRARMRAASSTIGIEAANVPSPRSSDRLGRAAPKADTDGVAVGRPWSANAGRSGARE